MEKVSLVTGGGGFLGSHLVDRLINQGNRVIVADNFFTGSKSNLSHQLHHEKLEIIRHDINLPLYIEIDEIWNLACPASPKHYQHDPVQTIKTSVAGSINMLGLAKLLHRRAYFQASTSEVYGDPKVSHNQKSILEMSIRSVSGVVMTKVSGRLKHCFSIIIGSIV